MSTYPVGKRVVLSPADAVSRRASIRAVLEGTTPLGQIGVVNADPLGTTSEGDPLAYFECMPNLTRWYCYFWPLVSGNRQVVTRIHANQWTGNDNLLVYQTGHNQRFFIEPQVNQRAFVRRMFNEVSCDVLLISPALQGENQGFMPLIGKAANDTNGHQYLFEDAGLAPPTGTPLRYWLDGTIGAIDWMIAQHGPYDKIIAAGLSGGGQMTSLLAAIDPRITHSYSIAGSSPFGERPMGHDNEQMEGVLALGVDYPDLYFMAAVDGAAGVTRPARFIYGSDDPIFNRTWETHWPATLDFARAHGFGTDMVEVHVDYTSAHDISEAVAQLIVTDVLI